MKKTVLAILFCAFVYNVHAQCSIDPFIQQNFEVDAAILALREIQSDPNDVDYDNPFVPIARITPHLEKFSAIYNNPQNIPEIDSLFNEFQFRVNPVYGQTTPQEYKNITFSVSTSVSWVQTFKDTGVSGDTDLDNLMNQYQLSILYFNDLMSSGVTQFYLETSNNYLNMKALEDDFEAVPNIDLAEAFPIGDPVGINYSGVPYNITSYDFFGNPQYHLAEVCDIYLTNNGAYVFALYGNFCFTGCTVGELRYLTVSNDCSQVNFSRTLSNEDFELTNVSIYPNPASNVLNIQGIDHIQNVEVYSILGKKVTVSLNTTLQLDVSNLQNGIYFLKIIDNQNRTAIQKFIKR